MEWRVERFDEIDSTNSYLSEQAAGGAEPGLVAVAKHQTAGRGRLERRWTDEPGGALLFSVLLGPESAQIATRALGLAVLSALDLGKKAGLKWPNDILIEGRKVAGVLGEISSRSGQVTAVMVGCGLNLRGVPAGLEDSATYVAEHSSLPVDEVVFLARILAELDKLLQSPESVSDRYRSACLTIGQEVGIAGIGGKVAGVAVDVDTGGALIVRQPDGTDRLITFGDVSSR